ncbi:FIG00731696: hypothetical protein [Klebsiella pneumoniae IS53]|nr:FIG00731696: hypothetical protein [Klebsiella pneumoniae IS53]
MASITLSAAELLLHRLQALDVAYIFINSGTDYPPVIEAWAKARATGQKVPELVICPHEKRRHRHGPWLLPRHRQGAGGDGSHQRRASQRRLRRHQSGEQQYSGADFWRPHADKRTFPLRLP